MKSLLYIKETTILSYPIYIYIYICCIIGNMALTKKTALFLTFSLHTYVCVCVCVCERERVCVLFGRSDSSYLA